MSQIWCFWKNLNQKPLISLTIKHLPSYDQNWCPVAAILDLAGAGISQSASMIIYQIIRSNEHVYQVSHFWPNVKNLAPIFTLPSLATGSYRVRLISLHKGQSMSDQPMVCESPLQFRLKLAHVQIMHKNKSVQIFRDVGQAVSEI